MLLKRVCVCIGQIGMGSCLFLNLAVASTGTDRTAPRSLAAPVVYDQLMLILVGEKGTAAVVFGKEIDKGVHYSFRYRPVGGGPEVKGESLVCERVRLVPAKDDPKKNTVIDMGSKLIIEAAKIRIEWSYSKPGKGFVYYVPEKLKVLIGHARDFNTVDLDRFQEPQ